MVNTIYQGLIGEFAEKDVRPAVAGCLEQFMSRSNADPIALNRLVKGHPMWEALPRYKPQACGLHKPRWSIQRFLEHECEPGFLLKGLRSKHRSGFKRKKKELRAAYTGQIS
jgi:hypothetical protein